MKTMSRIAGLSLAAALTLPATQAFAVEEHYIDGVAVVGGYDVVSYHTEGKPMKGMSDYSATYQGATWHFASMKNQELFMADPAKYAPAYGGWCAAGASKGKKVPTKPELWAIVEGQLYLNSSDKAHNGLFLAKTDTVIRKGEANWKTIFATASDDLK